MAPVKSLCCVDYYVLRRIDAVYMYCTGLYWHSQHTGPSGNAMSVSDVTDRSPACPTVQREREEKRERGQNLLQTTRLATAPLGPGDLIGQMFCLRNIRREERLDAVLGP